MKRLLAIFGLALALLGSAGAQQNGWGFNTGADPAYVLTQTQTLVNAFSAAPTATRKALLNTTINTAVVCGAWDRLDVLYVMAAADSQAASLNWRNPGAFPLVVAGSPTFTANQGYTGNGTDAVLSTGYDPSTTSFGFSQNDAHAGAFILTTSASTAFDIYSAGTRVRIRGRTSGAQPQVALSTATGTIGAGGAVAPLYVSGTRSDATNQSISINGVFSSVAANTTNATAVGVISALGVTGGGQFTDRQMALFHVGRSLTQPHQACLYKAFSTYLQAIGAI